MLDLKACNARIADVANLHPQDPDPADIKKNVPRYKRSEIVFAKLFCSEAAAGFAAGELTSGKFAALYPAHVDVAESLEELRELLNSHERQLLAYGAHK